MNLTKISDFAFYLLAFNFAVMLPIAVWTGLVLAPILVISGLLPLMLFIAQKQYSQINWLGNKILYIIIVAILWMCASIIWSINCQASAELVAKITGMIALLIAILQYVKYMSAVRVKLLRTLFCYSYIFTILLFLEEVLSQGFLGFYFMKMLGSEFLMHNLNRGACILVVMFWAFMPMINNRKIAFVIFILLGLGVFNQLSQSAMVGYLISALAFLFTYFGKKIAINIISILLIIGVFANMFFIRNIDAEAIIIQYPSLPNSASHRLFIWEFVGEKSKNNNILGYGANVSRDVEGATDKIISDKVNILDDWVYIPLHPHNNIAQILLELGVVGVMIFAILLWVVIRKMYHSTDNDFNKSAHISAMLAYIIIGLIGFGAWQPWWLATALFSVVLTQLAQRNSDITKLDNL